MALVLEDGTVVAGANALADRNFADPFFADRGESRWIGTDPEKDEALIRGTDWLVKRWGESFKGQLKQVDQPLPFPRIELYRDRFLLPDDSVPDPVKAAVSVYAIRALLRADIAPDPAQTPGSGAVTEKQVQVGRLRAVTRFATPGETPGSEVIPEIPEADRWLTAFVRSSVTSSGVSFGGVSR